MTETNKKPRKVLKIVLRVFLALLLIALVVGFLFWNRYVNKCSLLAEYETPQGQEVFILGTLHTNHFKSLANYSMEDILSAADNIQPDAVYIEAREESFEKYGVVDGPIDMCVVYAYCQEHSIPTELIDWWVIDNDYQENTTDNERDDHIFTNISQKLTEAPENSRVLVICGSGHFSEQEKRFEDAGFKKQRLTNKSDYFAATDEPFEYPASVCEVWEGRAGFYAYKNPELVREDASLSDEIKDGFWSWDHDAYYNQQLSYCELFKTNKLFK